MSADDDGETEPGGCPYCLGKGTVKRRYGTVGPGPAKRVKRRECPLCEGTGSNRNADAAKNQETEDE